MKDLKDFLNKSVNESAVPAILRKLDSDIEIERVEGQDGSGWLIGEWLDPFDGEYSNDYFRLYTEECIKVFKSVQIAGEDIKRPVTLKKALGLLEQNGEDPEGNLGYVLLDGEKTPILFSDVMFD